MHINEDHSKVRVLKFLLCLLFTLIVVFFIVQVSLSSSNEYKASANENLEAKGSEQTQAEQGSFRAALERLAALDIKKLSPSWELSVSGEVFMADEGDYLYLTGTSGRVMAVKASSGSMQWSLDLGVWVSAPPTVQSGVVYVGATNHVLYALDAGSGALLWYYTCQGEILAEPVVSDGSVFVCADNNSVYNLSHRLYALDARSGTLKWTYDTDSWTPSPPAVTQDAVYLGGYHREVYALDKLTGRKLWSFAAPNIVLSSPQVASGQIVFTCVDGWVYALDAASARSNGR